MYSLSPTTVTNWLLGEWSKDVANISVEPISLVERRRRLPSVNEVDGEEEGLEIVWRFPERTLWLRE
jgi:hypothetical protein